MEIRFGSKKLQKAANDLKAGDHLWGPQIAVKVRQRLNELLEAETLADMSRLTGTRCHPLGQNREGQFAVDVKHPRRLIFAPNHDPIPRLPDGGIALAMVTAIVVLGVEDYH